MSSTWMMEKKRKEKAKLSGPGQRTGQGTGTFSGLEMGKEKRLVHFVGRRLLKGEDVWRLCGLSLWKEDI